MLKKRIELPTEDPIPLLADGCIRIYDPEELIAGKIIKPQEWGSPTQFKDFTHPGWCYMRGCPRARQVNGSLVCRYHAH